MAVSVALQPSRNWPKNLVELRAVKCVEGETTGPGAS